jgi:exosortase A
MATLFDRTISVPRAELGVVARQPVVMALALVLIAILVAYADTAASIFSIWSRSDTFAHGFVIVPLAIWLAWQQRAVLYALNAKIWYPGLALIFGAGALWLVSRVAHVQVGQHFALAFMLQAAVLTLVGLSIARQIALPVGLLLFAVPFGEFMIPTLVEWTADFTIAALRASGVPVFREGNHFVIPSGAWSVVEACSGSRYLFASVVFGVVIGALCFRSPWRRAIFIGASAVVPLIANWLRAYLIVLIAHLTDNRLGTGVDHQFYGLVLFGVAMALLFWIGSFWYDDAEPAGRLRAAPAHASSTNISRLLVASVLAVAAAAVWRLPGHWIDGPDHAQPVMLSELRSGGDWQPSSEPVTPWAPFYRGRDAELKQYFKSGNLEAGIFVAFYRAQTERRELITSSNGLIPKESTAWKVVSDRVTALNSSGTSVDVRRSVIAGPSQRVGVYSLYWINGRLVANEYLAKLMLIESKLRGRGDDSALIAFYMPFERNDVETWTHLDQFVATMMPEVEHMLRAASQR